MTELDLLVEARKVISNKRNWCQHTLTKKRLTLTGIRTQYCAIGALWITALNKSEISDSASIAFSDWVNHDKALSALNEIVPGGYVGIFNDAHTHAEVLAVFDKAIANVKARHTVKKIKAEALEWSKGIEYEQRSNTGPAPVTVTN